MQHFRRWRLAAATLAGLAMTNLAGCASSPKDEFAGRNAEKLYAEAKADADAGSYDRRQQIHRAGVGRSRPARARLQRIPDGRQAHENDSMDQRPEAHARNLKPALQIHDDDFSFIGRFNCAADLPAPNRSSGRTVLDSG